MTDFLLGERVGRAGLTQAPQGNTLESRKSVAPAVMWESKPRPETGEGEGTLTRRRPARSARR